MCYILLHFCKLWTNISKGRKINPQGIGYCSWKKVNYRDQNLDLDVGVEEKLCKGEISLVISRIFL